MQDEHRQLQEVQGQQHADGKKPDKSKHYKGTPPATVSHTLKRTWSTEKKFSGEKESKHTLETSNSSAVDRWSKESMREQPWHNIGAIPELPASKGTFAMRGETGSNSAVAGSEQQKLSESDK